MNSMNHKMLSLMIHAGYEGIDQKQCIFFAMSILLILSPSGICFRLTYWVNGLRVIHKCKL